MNKPNRFISLSKTNYFANLKKKTGARDQKEQSNFNVEVLNCIAALDARIAKLESRLSEFEGATVKAFNAVVDTTNENIVPAISVLIRDLYERHPELLDEKLREKLREKGKNSVEEETSEDGQKS